MKLHLHASLFTGEDDLGSSSPMTQSGMEKYSAGKSSSDQEVEAGILPKDEAWDIDVPSESVYIKHIGESIGCSSGTSIRSSLVGMGFSPSLVDKVIDENGKDNVDLLLETLFTYSALQKSNSLSSDSIDELFSDIKNVSSPPEFEAESHTKQEPGMYEECTGDKRTSLLMMKFSVAEIDFAMDKLGEDASVVDIVDFIVAAQIAENPRKGADPFPIDGENNKGNCTEAMYGIMDTTLHLLEMGFSENEVSLVIDKYGSKLPISDLAEFIVAGRIFDECAEDDKSSIPLRPLHSQTERDCGSSDMGMASTLKQCSNKRVKLTGHGAAAVSQFARPEKKTRKVGAKQDSKDGSRNFLDPMCFEDMKPGLASCSTPWLGDLHDVGVVDNKFGVAKLPTKIIPCSSDTAAAKAPYFFYGSVADLPRNTWTKISKFLYGLEPEHVHTQFYSALMRKEGYIHNLPVVNRFHVLPKPEMTIQDAIPDMKKWCPSWDTRKKLNGLACGAACLPQLCDRIGKILSDHQGRVSVEQQNDILHHCWKWNLVWVGQYKVAPVEPEPLEHVLGYPLGHSRGFGCGLMDRWRLLEQCFQTDTLGYHLSVLRAMFPLGLTILSLYSGIGGAEVALHRLGIRLRGVVSVEMSEGKRRILQKWWDETGQEGELVQIDDIQKVGGSRLERLMKKFGGFEVVICQNPGDFDFSMFFEFVRVLQGVRSIMERNT